MHLKRLELNGFKSFAKKSEFIFDVPIIAVVGPNGSGKSNVVEAIRFVLGEQSVKSMRGKTGSDFIFKGSRDIPQLSRAAVTIVFDNTDRVFKIQNMESALNVDFDEITISREVYQDGSNKYLINGNEVRMRDIHELISSVNIGSSGHHIISQGEADRYLNAPAKDRKELIEEALGLKMYHYRIKESEKKLKRTEENLRESEMLRREIAPHLKFLKKQVEIIEKAKQLREELHEKYTLYFAREDALITQMENDLNQETEILYREKNEIDSFLDIYVRKNTHESKDFHHQYTEEQKKLELTMGEVSRIKQELGRIEGMLSVLENQSSPHSQKEIRTFSYTELEILITDVVRKIEALAPHTLEEGKNTLKKFLHSFIEKKDEAPLPLHNEQQITELFEKKKQLLAQIDSLSTQEQVIQQSLNTLKNTLETLEQERRDQERTYYEYLGKQKELTGKEALLVNKKEMLANRVQSRAEELQEAQVLLGEMKLTFSESLSLSNEVDVHTQEHFRRDIERIKIRIEDMGGGSGGDVIREYEETLERDAFLAREINDISISIQSLEDIIKGLKESLHAEFVDGIKKINEQFDRFFKLMFGGGRAELNLVDIKKRKRKDELEEEYLQEEDEGLIEQGIDIHVELPRKKVSDLDMLSGGERSLTSIALLFALSQVNPPPFLVLDETDAALDEANSQRYGDMIESLSQFSQLVVVTHNRETMSRAQTLFGVTLGKDDASTVLSLRLEDATQYAK